MKFYAMALLFLSSTSALATYQAREYNTWYAKDAVLSVMTQTSEGLPVMVSFSHPGQNSANLVISQATDGECADGIQTLNVNGAIVPAAYTCIDLSGKRIEHFTVADADHVNDMFAHLRSDFTLLLQGNIKVWAANVKKPRYGIAPKF